MGFEAMASDALADVLTEIIAAHPDEWQRFCAGDEGEQKKLRGFFTGKVMAATSNKANGKDVAAELARRRAG
jgi:aspartyl-tRNA(Asn)/glutamyl-tRNA(Gln) amidotransferase subunit B